MPDWRTYVRNHLPRERFRGGMEQEIEEEIAAHLEDVYAEARSRGATEAEAEARALEEVRDWENLAASILRTRRGAGEPALAWRMEEAEVNLRTRGGVAVYLADTVQELRLTFRRLGRASGFTAVVLMTLGIGMGATTAISSVVKSVLLDPLPYQDAHELVGIWNAAPGMGEDDFPQSLALNAVYEDESRVFQDVGAWNPGLSTVMGPEGPREIPIVSVTHGIFPSLRVEPALGRAFTFEDTQVRSPLTVILAHHYWEGEFDADRGVLGRTVEVNGSQREIIGVMPEGFRFLDRDPDLYLPLRYDKASLSVTQFNFQSLGRLRDGVTLPEALADMERVLPIAPERYPGVVTWEMLEEVGAGPVLRPLKEDLVGDVGRILWVVLGGVGIILLVACANVANLLLVRAERRERSVAVQTAMGSSGRRILRQFVAESLVLGLLGGLLGVGFAYGGLKFLVAAGPADLPRLQEVGLDPGILLFAFSVAVLSGLALGFLPLFRLRGMDLVSALKEGGRGASAGKTRSRTRNALVVAQLAMALVLLAGSGLMIRSFLALSRVNPGFNHPEELLTFRLTIGSSEVQDQEQVGQAFEAMANRIAELPGVTSVGVSTSVAMDGRGGYDPIFFEDFPLAEGQAPRVRRFKWVGGKYPETMGNPVVAGRSITWDDIRNRNRVAMITENLAREAWGDPARAVGSRINAGLERPGDWREVVGVVGDVMDDGVEQGPVDIVYWPMVLEGWWDLPFWVARSMVFAVRSPRVGTPGFLEEVRDLVWSAYPNRPLGTIITMEERLRGSMARTSFTLVMLGIAAVVALLLGSIGIYGVISFAVGQRTQELGLRIAMGAEAGAVVGMVLKQGLGLGLVGMAIGLGAAFGVTRLMEAVLFGVDPVDPLTFGLVSVGLLGVALLASWIPAHRASRVDPVVALRAE